MKTRLIPLLLFLALNAAAQVEPEPDRTAIIEQRLEQIAESMEDEDLDYSELFDRLMIYLDFPLNLNTADEGDLYGMGLLANDQIREFLEYRRKYGALLSIYELPYIPGWNSETVQTILPFIEVKPDLGREKITWEKLIKYAKHDLFVRYQRDLEEKKGYKAISPEELAENPNSRYLGSPDKVYMRYRYRYADRISFGITAEKDSGEEFFKGSQPNGFDFYSAHLFLSDFGVVKDLAIGDFQARFGQGLTFWSGLGFNRKSSFSVSTEQFGGGLGAYTSVNENLFLRGGGATVSLGDVEVTAFYSGKKIDGNLVESSDSTGFDDVETVVSSFQESGYHRTPREVEDKNSIFQEHFGAHLHYRKGRFQIGATAVHMRLDGGLRRKFVPYSRFRFNKGENTVMGLDYTWNYRNFHFFGETSRSENGAFATLNGVNVDLHPRLQVNVTMRHYERDFQGIASAAFGEGSQIENETGVYFGVELRPFKRWKVNAYIDQFKFPWLRYRTDAPTQGSDFFTQVEYHASSRTTFYARYRDRSRRINASETAEGAKNLVDNPRRSIRLDMTHRASSRIRLRSRVEFSRYQRGEDPVSKGFMVYQDVSYTLKNLPLRISARYALFDTDTYDSRIYAYESDVLYAFSIPAYAGRGARTYVLFKYDLGRNVDLWLRWAQTYYTDRNLIGSGLDEIEGNTRTEIKAQMRLKF